MTLAFLAVLGCLGIALLVLGIALWIVGPPKPRDRRPHDQ